MAASYAYPVGYRSKLDARLPRTMGACAWRYADLVGYTSAGVGTSILPVRPKLPARGNSAHPSSALNRATEFAPALAAHLSSSGCTQDKGVISRIPMTGFTKQR